MNHADKVRLRIREVEQKREAARAEVAPLIGSTERTPEQDARCAELTRELGEHAGALQRLNAELAVAEELDRQEEGELAREPAAAGGGFAVPAMERIGRVYGITDPRVTELLQRCEVGNYFDAFGNGRNVSGAEAELNQALGLRDNRMPLAAFDRVLSRAAGDAATTGFEGDTGYPRQVMRIHPEIFAASLAPVLGIEMPMVGIGDASFPMVSTPPTADVRNPGQSQGAGKVVIEPNSLEPRRLTSRVLFRLETALRVGDSVYRMALAENIRASLSDEWDRQCIVGDGVDPNIEGLLAQLPAAPAVVGEDTFQTYSTRVAGHTEGNWAENQRDLVVIVGQATYGHAAGIFATGTATSVTDRLESRLRRFQSHARMPAPVGNVQQSIVFRASRSQMYREMGDRGRGGPDMINPMPPVVQSALHPVWGYLQVDDRYTDAASGEESLTVHAFVGHRVAVVQPDAYARTAFRLAA